MTELLNALFRSLSPLWEMSLTAAYVTAVVVLLRLVLKKRAPKQVLCLLWLVVFARLLIPVNLESPLSIVPDAGQVQMVQALPSKLADGMQGAPAEPPVQNDAPVQNPAQGLPGGVTVEPVFQGNAAPALAVPGNVTPSAPQAQPQTGFSWQALLAGVWLAGALAMCLYGLAAYLRLKRCLFDAIRAEDGAWEHPAVNSPFILGMLRPRIYLPAGLWGQPRMFILCHERAHLRRLDHIVKPICWLALALHWFNPVVWAAFILMSRDIEAACDESVIRQLGPRVKADYSATLLSLATSGRVPAPCPLAFDEGDAKSRIQNVLRYRRPALWIVVVSVIMALMAAVCLLTDPVSAEEPDHNPNPDASASQPPESNLADTVLDPWMLEVLNGERTFSTLFNNEAYGINDLRSFYYGDDQFPDAVVRMGKLAVVDMDRDGVNELVIYPVGDPSDSYEVFYNIGYLMLRRQGDNIYGWAYGPRICGNLKADGTYWWSEGVAYGGYASMSFDGNEPVHNRFTWREPGDLLGDELYFVNGLKATQAEFDAACAAQDAKPDPIWYVFEDGQLKYPPINVPIPLDDAALSVAVPDFLDADQQLLYRQMYAMYIRIFGINSEECDSWPTKPGTYGGKTPVEYNGAEYCPADGLYASWNDFEQAVLSVFTQRFWEERNGPDLPTYVNIGGTMHYLPWARGGGGYNENFPETFRLVEQTDDTISFIMTGYYSEHHLLDGETSEDRAARMAAYYESTIEFPMRMVKTENGWRFDEFHCARTDNGLLQFSSQAVPNPNAPAAPSVEPTPTPERTVISELGDMQIVTVGNVYRLHWKQNGQDFPVGPDTVSPSYGPWLEDFDEDGSVEAIFPETGSFPFTIYDHVNGALVGHSHPDMDEIYAEIVRNAVAAYNPNSRGLTVTYSWNGAYVPSYTVLPEGFFAGCEELADGRPLYVTLQRGAVNGVNVNPGDLWYRAQVTLTDGATTGPVVGNLNFTVHYSDSGFELRDPGEVQWLPAIEA